MHWAGDGKGTLWMVPGREYTRLNPNPCPCTSWRWKEGERFIDEAVDIYEQVYRATSRSTTRSYPTPAYLKSRDRTRATSSSTATSPRTRPGSNRIKELLLDDEAGPVYLLAWGGPEHDRARAEVDQAAVRGHAASGPRSTRRSRARRSSSPSATRTTPTPSTSARTGPRSSLAQMSTGTYGYGARNSILPENAATCSTRRGRRPTSPTSGRSAPSTACGATASRWSPGDIFDYFGFSRPDRGPAAAMGYAVWTGTAGAGLVDLRGRHLDFMNLLDNGLRGARERVLRRLGRPQRRGREPGDRHAQQQLRSRRASSASPSRTSPRA